MSPFLVPLRAIRQPSFLYGCDGAILDANDLAEALAGQRLSGLSPADVLRTFRLRHPDGSTLLLQELPACRALAGEDVVDEPFSVMLADGRSIDVLASASTIRVRDAIVGALVVWQDVTEKKQAEEALRRSEAQYRELVEHAGSIILRLDTCGRITFFNEFAQQFFGYSAEEILGRLAVGTIIPETESDGRNLAEMVREIVHVPEKFRNNENENIRKDGGRVWVRWTNQPIYDAGGAVREVLAVGIDITDRKRAEEEQSRLLRTVDEQRGRLQAIIDSMPIGLWFVDADGKMVFINEAGRELWGGAAPEAESVADYTRYPVWRPGTGERLAAGEMPLARALQGATCRDTVLEFERFDGTRGTQLVSAAPIRTADGTIAGAVALVRDITRRQRAEEALRESEADARSFMENMVDACAICETVVDSVGEPVDIRVVEVNPAFLHDLPLPVERVVGQTASSILPTMDRAWFDRFLEVGRTGRAMAFEEPFPALGRLYEVAGFLVRGGRIAVVFHDITEQRQAEESVLERERVVQSIFRAAPAGIGLISSLHPGRRRFEQVNDRLLEMSGFTRSELIGYDSRILYPDDEAYAAVARDSTPQLEACGRGEVETTWRRKDGTTFNVLLSSSLIDPQDAEAGVIFIALDLSPLHESQRSLKRYARDLKRSNEELQRFAYVASHDLQEPLRSIVSFSQLLERRCRGRLGQDADDYIAFIVEGGVRMQALIQDLLQVSRVETRAQEPAPTDVYGPVGDALRSLEPAIREAGATITVDDLPVVMADEAQLVQVFTNLVGNALKYRRPDVPPEVRISAERRNGTWEFSVADNGIGIEPEYFDRIFEMFRRLHTKEEYDGTGIGLAVVKKIVERHGGTVRVESMPGEGSIFYFTLPAG